MNRDSPTMKSKIARKIRQDGIVALVKRGIPYVWNQVVASRLPKQTVQYNGVLIKKEIRVCVTRSTSITAQTEVRVRNYLSAYSAGTRGGYSSHRWGGMGSDSNGDSKESRGKRRGDHI